MGHTWTINTVQCDLVSVKKLESTLAGIEPHLPSPQELPRRSCRFRFRPRLLVPGAAIFLPPITTHPFFFATLRGIKPAHVLNRSRHGVACYVFFARVSAHCFLVRHALAIQSSMIVCAPLLLSLLWVFFSPANGSAANLVSNGSAIICIKSPNPLGPERGGHAEQVLIGTVRQEQPFIPASFLLFDFKQNLRQWPVLSGDISRSPPFFRVVLAS